MSSKTVTWAWQYWQNSPYLTCSLLADWKHGFFTQHFSPQTPEVLVNILNPKAQAYRVRQIHSNKILKATEIKLEENNSFSPADGIISDNRQQAVWVASADCTPVLIADINTHRVAAVHAGWRGTAQDIVPETIALMQAEGSRLENLRIALGPAINGTVYQVTKEVAAEVGSSLIKNKEITALEKILEALEAMIDSPLHPDTEQGKVRLDVRRVNQLQMEQLGIKPEQIAIAPYCTYQQPEYFFSYRRSQEKKVQWSGIVSKE